MIYYSFARALSADSLKLGQLTEMPKNFYPEWGYLAPAPSFIRTIRIVLLGMVIGATASGGVVLSLVDRPVSQTSAVARTLAPPVQAAPTPVSAPETEQPNPRAVVQNESTKSGANGHLESAAAPVTPGRADIAPLAEVHPDEAAVKATTAPPTAVAAPVENKAIKKQHVATHYYASRGGLFGFVPSEHHTNRTWGEPYREGHWGGSYQNGRGRHHASGY